MDESDIDKPENMIVGEFLDIESDMPRSYKGLPMITKFYGLLLGKWDYSEQNQANLPDVINNLRVAEQMMKLMGATEDTLTIITDPTVKQVREKVMELNSILFENKKKDNPENICVGAYFGGHGVMINNELHILLQGKD